MYWWERDSSKCGKVVALHIITATLLFYLSHAVDAGIIAIQADKWQ